MKKNEVLALGLAIGLTELAGGVGALFTTPAIATWYPNLVQPVGTPPDFVFGPVWTTLFALMGIALFLIWRQTGLKTERRQAFILFGAQMILNVLWSALFFGLKSFAAASVEIVCLWLAIVATQVAFAKVSRPAAWLLLPYLLWVSFATYLTLAFWSLN